MPGHRIPEVIREWVVGLATTTHAGVNQNHQGAQRVQVLAGAVEVDDLDRAREVLTGQTPDPGCPVAEHDQPVGLGVIPAGASA